MNVLLSSSGRCCCLRGYDVRVHNVGECLPVHRVQAEKDSDRELGHLFISLPFSDSNSEDVLQGLHELQDPEMAFVVFPWANFRLLDFLGNEATPKEVPVFHLCVCEPQLSQPGRCSLPLEIPGVQLCMFPGAVPELVRLGWRGAVRHPPVRALLAASSASWLNKSLYLR